MTGSTNRMETDGTQRPSDASGGSAPPLLPDDPQVFWSAAVDLDTVELPPERELKPALERLAPSPFPRSGFPLIGFLATVYEHVSAYARQRDDAPSVPPETGAGTSLDV